MSNIKTDWYLLHLGGEFLIGKRSGKTLKFSLTICHEDRMYYSKVIRN